jgi:large subunit ribosomal protein L15
VSKNDKVKILGRGELKAKVEVTAHAFTASAKKLLKLQAVLSLKFNK